MTYGFLTHSYLNSTEKRQMDQERKESTDRHLGRCHCGVPAQHLCAWKIPKWQRFLEKDSERCERPICNVHAKIVSRPGEDQRALCPEHQLRYDDWKRKHNRQGELFGEAA